MNFNLILNKRELKIFITFFLIYLYFITWDGWNEDSGFSLTKAIIGENRFEISNYANYTGDRLFYKGNYYSSKFPGEPFLSVPIYAAFNFLYSNLPTYFTNHYTGDNKVDKYYADIPDKGKVEFYYNVNPGGSVLLSMILVTALTSSLFSSMTVLLIYKISNYFTQQESHKLSLAIAYGLATLIFPNALVFTGFGTSTFFLFLSFFLLFKTKYTKADTDKYFIISGLSIGLGIVVRPEIIPIAMLFFAYSFFIKKEKIFLFLVGFLLGIMPLFAYSYSTFSTSAFYIYLHSGYQDPSIWGSISQTRNFEEVGYYIEKDPAGVVFWLLPYKGLFFYHPIFLFCLISFYFMYREFKKESILFILILSILISFSIAVWLLGVTLGASFGIRFLTASSPFLIIPFLYFIRKFGLKTAWIIIVIGIFINFLGLQIYDSASMYGYTGWWENNSGFRERIYSFEINPLVDYYIPLFMDHGPRSRIFEGLISEKVPDIRSGLGEFDKFQFNPINIIEIGGQEIQLITKFLCLVPIFLIVFLIWRKEILNLIKFKIKWMNQKILLASFLIIFLILFIRIY